MDDKLRARELTAEEEETLINNVGRGRSHDSNNKKILENESTIQHADDLLDRMLDDINTLIYDYGNRLSLETELCPYLSYVLLAARTTDAMPGVLEWYAARSIAISDSKTNVARASGQSLPTLMKRNANLDEVVDKIIQSARSNKVIDVDLHGRNFKIFPDENAA